MSGKASDPAMQGVVVAMGEVGSRGLLAAEAGVCNEAVCPLLPFRVIRKTTPSTTTPAITQNHRRFQGGSEERGPNEKLGCGGGTGGGDSSDMLTVLSGLP